MSMEGQWSASDECTVLTIIDRQKLIQDWQDLFNSDPNFRQMFSLVKVAVAPWRNVATWIYINIGLDNGL